jgi:outer membrane biosynthesis protein TonB
MPRRKSILTVLLLVLGSCLTIKPATAAKRDQSPCGKPPDLVSKAPLPKEEQARARKIRAQGTVAIVVSEGGDVADAKVVVASSEEAGKILIDLVRGMKFKPRPGCGAFKTSMNFSLAE